MEVVGVHDSGNVLLPIKVLIKVLLPTSDFPTRAILGFLDIFEITFKISEISLLNSPESLMFRFSIFKKSLTLELNSSTDCHALPILKTTSSLLISLLLFSY